MKQILGLSRWLALISGFLAFALIVLAWLEIRNGSSISVGKSFEIVFIFSIITFLINHSLVINFIHLSWRERFAFLASAALGLLLWLLFFILQPAISSLIWPVCVLVGAFIGALVTTSLREGLWEDNYPPTEMISTEVHQRHIQIIGQPARTPRSKRIFDFLLASLGMILSTPIWILSTCLVWLEDPGPLLFVKNSVGKGGVNFRQFKFRTMVREAEVYTGPIMSGEGDERVLMFGRLLRKTALDELPQLINILRGEMSFVGPRPQRTILVHRYLEEIPEYAERHQVLPGLAGLAQVAGDYYLTPRQKLRYDRLYIRSQSVGFDLKLILLAILTTFWYRWQTDWSGKLPRWLFRLGTRKRSFPKNA